MKWRGGLPIAAHFLVIKAAALPRRQAAILPNFSSAPGRMRKSSNDAPRRRHADYEARHEPSIHAEIAIEPGVAPDDDKIGEKRCGRGIAP